MEHYQVADAQQHKRVGHGRAHVPGTDHRHLGRPMAHTASMASITTGRSYGHAAPFLDGLLG
jgi:hypothetical protein